MDCDFRMPFNIKNHEWLMNKLLETKTEKHDEEQKLTNSLKNVLEKDTLAAVRLQTLPPTDIIDCEENTIEFCQNIAKEILYSFKNPSKNIENKERKTAEKENKTVIRNYKQNELCKIDEFLRAPATSSIENHNNSNENSSITINLESNLRIGLHSNNSVSTVAAFDSTLDEDSVEIIEVIPGHKSLPQTGFYVNEDTGKRKRKNNNNDPNKRNGTTTECLQNDIDINSELFERTVNSTLEDTGLMPQKTLQVKESVSDTSKTVKRNKRSKGNQIQNRRTKKKAHSLKFNLKTPDVPTIIINHLDNINLTTKSKTRHVEIQTQKVVIVSEKEEEILNFIKCHNITKEVLIKFVEETNKIIIINDDEITTINETTTPINAFLNFCEEYKQKISGIAIKMKEYTKSSNKEIENNEGVSLTNLINKVLKKMRQDLQVVHNTLDQSQESRVGRRQRIRKSPMTLRQIPGINTEKHNQQQPIYQTNPLQHSHLSQTVSGKRPPPYQRHLSNPPRHSDAQQCHCHRQNPSQINFDNQQSAYLSRLLHFADQRRTQHMDNQFCISHSPTSYDAAIRSQQLLNSTSIHQQITPTIPISSTHELNNLSATSCITILPTNTRKNQSSSSNGHTLPAYTSKKQTSTLNGPMLPTYTSDDRASTLNGRMLSTYVSNDQAPTLNGPMLPTYPTRNQSPTLNGPTLPIYSLNNQASTLNGPILPTNASKNRYSTSNGPMLPTNESQNRYLTSNGPMLPTNVSNNRNSTTNGPMLPTYALNNQYVASETTQWGYDQAVENKKRQRQKVAKKPLTKNKKTKHTIK